VTSLGRGLAAALVASGAALALRGDPGIPRPRYAMTGPLVAASTTMVTAWEVPANPLTDPSLDDSRLSEQIRWGYRIFTDTPKEAPRFARGKVSCSNCHLNAGQRERALPLVGIAGMFPEYNARANRLISLADRVVDCFMRSENGAGHLDESTPVEEAQEHLPSPASQEVLAATAYVTWLAKKFPVGENPPWRNRNAIPAANLIPLDRLDPGRGEKIYLERCASCHGADGQGVRIGDRQAGPLWGADSWNDGAGAARVYTLAGIIRYSMPYLDPGRLSDEEAQLVAAFINSKPRPRYPFKARDYVGTKVPVDAVYYLKEKTH
jgi:thiosulfate dehydrogenase